MPKTDWSHHIVLAARRASASEARDFVSLHLPAHHLSHLVEDMRVVVSELATNAVAHAQTPFVVTLSRVGETVLLDVRDGSSSSVVPTAPDVMDMGGRGLMIVESLSQDWGTRSDGYGFKSVWASFPCHS